MSRTERRAPPVLWDAPWQEKPAPPPRSTMPGFMGYTPDIVAGVWVGFDEERSLGRSETGGHAALPIWLEYMKVAHEGLPPRGFPVPDGVVFANIDNETGQLVGSGSKSVVRQAFIDGTEPGSSANPTNVDQDKNFYKEDMSE